MIEIKKYSINDTNLFIGTCSALGAFNIHTRPLQETQYGENKAVSYTHLTLPTNREV